MEDKTFELLTKLYSEFVQFKNEVNEFKSDITENVNKTNLVLENVQDKLHEMSEIQESHYEENQRHHQEIVELLTEKITTVEIAVKNANIKAVK